MRQRSSSLTRPVKVVMSESPSVPCIGLDLGLVGSAADEDRLDVVAAPDIGAVP